MTNETIHQHPPAARIERLLARCTSPLMASRAADKVHSLARRKAVQARSLYDLSDALSEYRHQLRCERDGLADEAAEHRAMVERCVARALRGAR